jgi:hypothetical protein
MRPDTVARHERRNSDFVGTATISPERAKMKLTLVGVTRCLLRKSDKSLAARSAPRTPGITTVKRRLREKPGSSFEAIMYRSLRCTRSL